jgi:hypothetical protein
MIVRHSRLTKSINFVENNKKRTCDDNITICKKDFAQAVWEKFLYQLHML